MHKVSINPQTLTINPLKVTKVIAKTSKVNKLNSNYADSTCDDMATFHFNLNFR